MSQAPVQQSINVVCNWPSWRICTQQETLPFARGVITVKCRHIKVRKRTAEEMAKDPCTPDVKFAQLKYVVLNVKIASKHEELSIQLSTYWGLRNPKYTIKHEGSTRTTRLDGVIEIPGIKEEYDQRDFEARMNKMVGPEFTAEVLQAFTGRLMDLLEKYPNGHKPI